MDEKNMLAGLKQKRIAANLEMVSLCAAFNPSLKSGQWNVEQK